MRQAESGPLRSSVPARREGPGILEARRTDRAGGVIPVSDSPIHALGRLPAVGRLLESETFRALAGTFGRPMLTRALREEIAGLRRAVRADALPRDFTRDPERWLADAVRERLARAEGPVLRRVINATGVAAHTNLGRAPLSARAAAQVFRVASGYANLEFDLETGVRGSRQDHLGGLLEKMFPGRAALVVNNAAGAVLLALDTLAAGKEVVVSRGELVEIGDSFRIPEILEKSGARLVEVGTTNRTRLDDYRRAVSEADGQVGALLKVHQSNFRIIGFTEAVPTRELAGLGAEFGIPVIEDFGSGNLAPLAEFGVEGGDEPTVAERVAAGADLVIFSGDKLVGGPQAGILLGAAEAVAACRRNPLARALRADKTQIAGLQATLWSHATGRAASEIPVIRAIARPLAEVAAAAERLVESLDPSSVWSVDVVASTSRIGGGAAPGAGLPSRSIALSHRATGADAIRARLLRSEPPVVSRIVDGQVLLDLRTVSEDEMDELRAVLQAVTGG